MRHALIALSLCSSLTLPACKSQLDDKPKAVVKDAKPSEGKDAKAGEAKADAAKGKTATLDAAKSKVGFVGAKVTADHEGAFAKVSGSLGMDGTTPTSLEITVETASLEIDPPDLQKHLLSPDFFGAEANPESKFVSSAIREKAGEGGATHEIEGNLTLHGQTKTIVFPAKVEVGEALAKGTAEFKIDRKDFGITYPGMPDDLIKDEVLLKLDLSFPLS